MNAFGKFMVSLAVCSWAAVGSIGVAEAQTRYIVTDLGVLPGAESSTAIGINDLGDVVGYASGGSVNSVGFVWRQGVMTGVGKLPKGNYSSATAINSLGTFVGDGDTGDYRPQSWVNTGSGLYNFFSNNGGNTHVVSISDRGAIGGYYTKSLSGWVSSWRGAIWTPDPKDPRKYRQVDLPVIYGPDPTFKGTTAIPAAFNQGGQAAGYAANEVIGQHAAFWNNDAAHSIIDLGTLPGDWSSLAWGINELGQAVGESHPPFGSRPTLWDRDAAHTPTELPLLPGDNYGTAVAINRLGHIVGWSAYAVPGTWNVGPSRWVVWRDGGVYDIESLLDPITGAGWSISNLAALNNAGQIVGTGISNGQAHALLLTPAP